MPQAWRLLRVPEKPEAARLALRLNALGSLYFFSKSILKRNRLSDRLHLPIAKSLEREGLQMVLEIPRDHLKTTLVTESLSMWWALPFTDTDEALMRELGYEDEWIRWMKKVHNPDTRTLIVTENEGNAIRFGTRIDSHYESGDVFRSVFPEIIPDKGCTWNATSKHQKRTATGLGEGTYEFLGVGGAVQSRHYDRIIEDDLVGREARNSEIVMDDTIQYHRLLSGVFDSSSLSPDKLGEEIVVGNRWSFFDLNGWIREHEPHFEIQSHSAEGGCCSLHPYGEPIFPEEFSLAKLQAIRERISIEDFSHQYLNQAVLPGEQVFEKDWLRFFNFIESRDGSKRLFIQHEVREGEARKDVSTGILFRTLIVDPNHAGEEGRCNHSIVMMGLNPDTEAVYLLDLWARTSSYDDLVANIWAMAKKWRMGNVWIETVAAQKYLKYHLEFRNRTESFKINFRELPIQRGKNSKDERIKSLEPIVRNGRFYAKRDQTQFLSEYYTYPATKTKDVLDCIGYGIQTFDSIRFREVIKWARDSNQRTRERSGITGY